MFLYLIPVHNSSLLQSLLNVFLTYSKIIFSNFIISHRSLICIFITHFVFKIHYIAWNFRKSLNHYIKYLNAYKDK